MNIPLFQVAFAFTNIILFGVYCTICLTRLKRIPYLGAGLVFVFAVIFAGIFLPIVADAFR